MPAPPLVRTPLLSCPRGVGWEGSFSRVPSRGRADAGVRKKASAAPRPRAEALSIRVRVLLAQKLFQPSQAEPSSRIVLARLTGTFFVPQHSSVPRQQKTSGKRVPSPEHGVVQVLRPTALGWDVGGWVWRGWGGPLRSGHPPLLTLSLGEQFPFLTPTATYWTSEEWVVDW